MKAEVTRCCAACVERVRAATYWQVLAMPRHRGGICDGCGLPIEGMPFEVVARPDRAQLQSLIASRNL